MTEAVSRIEDTEMRASGKINDMKNEAEQTIAASKSECSASAEKAKRWASNPEGVPVEDGLYSAYHYAKLAEFNNKGE